MAMTLQDQLRAEERKKAEADQRIAKLKAKEAERIGRIADKLGFYAVTVTDEQLAEGFRHAMNLAGTDSESAPGK